MDRLPEVTPSFGLPLVLTPATRTWSSPTSSSSAAIWARAVHTPWPYSTFPGRIVTMPLVLRSTHSRSRGLAARLGEGVGELVNGPPPAAHARPACSLPCSLLACARACVPGCLVLGGRAEHGLQDPLVRAAPAQVAVQRRAYVGLGRRRVVAQQGHRADDHPRRAVAALGRLLVHHRLLYRVHRAAVRQALHRGDVLALGRPGREVTGGPGPAADEHEARAAQPDPAAEPRPGQPEVLAQHVEQGSVRLAPDEPLRAVNRRPNIDCAHGHRVCIRLQT